MLSSSRSTRLVDRSLQNILNAHSICSIGLKSRVPQHLILICVLIRIWHETILSSSDVGQSQCIYMALSVRDRSSIVENLRSVAISLRNATKLDSNLLTLSRYYPFTTTCLSFSHACIYISIKTDRSSRNWPTYFRYVVLFCQIQAEIHPASICRVNENVNVKTKEIPAKNDDFCEMLCFNKYDCSSKWTIFQVYWRWVTRERNTHR